MAQEYDDDDKKDGIFLESGIFGLHNVMDARNTYNISWQYAALHRIGEGSYGIVSSALDLGTGKRVAIKKMTGMNLILMAQRTLREIRILRFLKHENVIDIYQVSQFDNFNEVYIVLPLIAGDLHHAMNERKFDDHEIAFIVYQLFKGLKYMHSASIIHRDLKPSNILVDESNNVKICDFGLARVVNDCDEKEEIGMTEYVSTRHYRAPEVMIAACSYDKAIDVWSVGCILAELMTVGKDRILFPGKCYLDMVRRFVEVLGTPTSEDLAYVVNARARNYILSQDRAARVDWAEKFPSRSPIMRDFLDQILKISPTARMTVDQALHHPLLSQFPEVPDYNFERPLLFEDNFYDLSISEIKIAIGEEIEKVETKNVKSDA